MLYMAVSIECLLVLCTLVVSLCDQIRSFWPKQPAEAPLGSTWLGVQNSIQSPASLGHTVNFPEPRFPHLSNGDFATPSQCDKRSKGLRRVRGPHPEPGPQRGSREWSVHWPASPEVWEWTSHDALWLIKWVMATSSRQTCSPKQ